VSDLAGTESVAESDVESATFWQRAVRLGQLPDDDLAATILSSSAVLLPITQGGGSNLKTAEALASGRRIVATSFAFRGYEDYLNVSGVAIADTPDEFRSEMIKAVKQPPPARPPGEVQRIQMLHWPARLTRLVEGIIDIAAKPHLG
jgi:glycosyltransferase involved in cell wall biosynthesis